MKFSSFDNFSQRSKETWISWWSNQILFFFFFCRADTRNSAFMFVYEVLFTRQSTYAWMSKTWVLVKQVWTISIAGKNAKYTLKLLRRFFSGWNASFLFSFRYFVFLFDKKPIFTYIGVFDYILHSIFYLVFVYLTRKKLVALLASSFICLNVLDAVSIHDCSQRPRPQKFKVPLTLERISRQPRENLITIHF